jgi:hypothetical protein
VDDTGNTTANSHRLPVIDGWGIIGWEIIRHRPLSYLGPPTFMFLGFRRIRIPRLRQGVRAREAASPMLNRKLDKNEKYSATCAAA